MPSEGPSGECKGSRSQDLLKHSSLRPFLTVVAWTGEFAISRHEDSKSAFGESCDNAKAVGITHISQCFYHAKLPSQRTLIKWEMVRVLGDFAFNCKFLGGRMGCPVRLCEARRWPHACTNGCLPEGVVAGAKSVGEETWEEVANANLRPSESITPCSMPTSWSWSHAPTCDDRRTVVV